MSRGDWPGRCGKEESKRRVGIWLVAKNDRDAAYRAGLTQPGWTKWRNEWGLPPKKKKLRFAKAVIKTGKP